MIAAGSLDALLDRIATTDALLALVDGDTRAQLEAERASLHAELIGRLIAAARAGGRVRLEYPRETEPRAEDEPVVRPIDEEPVLDGPIDAEPVLACPLDAEAAPALAPEVATPAVDLPAPAPGPAPAWSRSLLAILRSLLPTADPWADVERLVQLIDRREEWLALPAEVQVDLLSAIAARLRTLQREVDPPQLPRLFSAITAYSEAYRPGFAWGLQRAHSPRSGASWAEDTAVLLVALYRRVPDDLPLSTEGLRALAKVEDLVRELDVAPSEVRSAVLASLRREVLSALDAGVPMGRVSGVLGAVLNEDLGPELAALA